VLDEIGAVILVIGRMLLAYGLVSLVYSYSMIGFMSIAIKLKLWLKLNANKFSFSTKISEKVIT
jgi:hypothetical protein